MSGRRWPAALAVCALGLLAACGSDPTAPPAPPPAFAPVEELLTATATQTRVNIANGGEFRVVVSNRGAQPFTVTAVRLSSPAFTARPTTALSVDYPPGARYALETEYGEADCAVRSVEPLRAVLRLSEPAGEREVEVALDAPYDLMTRLHDRTCQERAFAQQATLGLGDGEVVDGPDRPELRTTLDVRRGTATGPVRIGSVRGSVVYALELAPVVLPAGQEEVRAPLTVRVATCAGHLIGETKQPYRFLAAATVDGQPELGVVVPTTSAQEGELKALLSRTCG